MDEIIKRPESAEDARREAEIPIAERRHRLPEGVCKYCDACRDDKMMPYHDASVRCESGKRNHCTCDTCY